MTKTKKIAHRVSRFCTASAAILYAASSLQAATRYVDHNAPSTPPPDGASWATAFRNPQQALSVAVAGDEIWVADGTYTPTSGSDRTISFVLLNNVKLYGGFAGTETLLSQRNVYMNVTTLSGDIGSPNNNGDNSYHVVNASDRDSSAILDGFTIKDGNANLGSTPHNRGGGILNYRNITTYFGPGATINNCVIENNSAILGGGMNNDNGANATITGCTFRGNTATSEGGGIYSNSTPLGPGTSILSCSFLGNTSPTAGGLFSNLRTTVANCVFAGNSASVGAGLYTIQTSTNTQSDLFNMTNCTVVGNAATTSGGGVANRSGGESGDPNFSNCIFWANTAPSGAQLSNIGSSPSVSYSDVEGGYAGVSNLNANPLFVDSDGPGIIDLGDGAGPDGDFGTTDDNLRLRSGSPCIDNGDNSPITALGITTDRDGNARITNGTVDRGAYELLDTDGDGVPDAIDGCPSDPLKTAPAICGCGVVDTDSDDDSLADCVDLDDDNDGLDDTIETFIAVGGCPSTTDADSDNDTLSDGLEVLVKGTSPCNPDTDGDNVTDDEDDMPLQPGVTSGFLENASRDTANDILNLPLTLFTGPNANANKGRRNALSNMATSAANLIAIGDYAGATEALAGLYEKIDGISPAPDWMDDSQPDSTDIDGDLNTTESARSALAENVALLIFLIDFLG